MVGLDTDTSTMTDSISIEMEYGIVLCDSMEVTDRVKVRAARPALQVDVPYFILPGFAAQINTRARGPPTGLRYR